MMKTVVSGKCIIAGEHAVLRGVPAFAVPVSSRSLELTFRPRVAGAGADVVTEFSGTHGSELRMLFSGVLDRALEMTSRSHADAAGLFHIKNEVPVGAGLGASATLCVAVGRFIAYKGWISEAELPEFCRQLENLFHGESSGLDIAVALWGQALHFERGGSKHPIAPTWKPSWCISYSGKRGITSECILKVKALWSTDLPRAQAIDEAMRAAVLQAEEAIQSRDESGRLMSLAKALNEACRCFESWGLAGGEMGQHLQLLRDRGAIAVKPTGSGDGGYALSLWAHTPPSDIHLIELS